MVNVTSVIFIARPDCTVQRITALVGIKRNVHIASGGNYYNTKLESSSPNMYVT